MQNNSTPYPSGVPSNASGDASNKRPSHGQPWKDEAKDSVERLADKAERTKDDAADLVKDAKNEASAKVDDLKDKAAAKTEEFKDKASDVADDVKEKVADTAQDLKEKGARAADKIQEKGEKVVGIASAYAKNAADAVGEKVRGVQDQYESAKSSTRDFIHEDPIRAVTIAAVGSAVLTAALIGIFQRR